MQLFKFKGIVQPKMKNLLTFMLLQTVFSLYTMEVKGYRLIKG